MNFHGEYIWWYGSPECCVYLNSCPFNPITKTLKLRFTGPLLKAYKALMNMQSLSMSVLVRRIHNISPVKLLLCWRGYSVLSSQMDTIFIPSNVMVAWLSRMLRVIEQQAQVMQVSDSSHNIYPERKWPNLISKLIQSSRYMFTTRIIWNITFSIYYIC